MLTGNLFISKSGSVFVFARLMQDGIVKRLLHDTCPPQGDIDWRLCAYKNRLPTNANGWLWGAGSGFHALGGFTSQTQQEEDSRIIVESLKRYPVMHLRAAVYRLAAAIPAVQDRRRHRAATVHRDSRTSSA